MIDVSAFGANYVQVVHLAGLSAHSMFLTRHEALELLQKLRLALDEREDSEALIPDD